MITTASMITVVSNIFTTYVQIPGEFNNIMQNHIIVHFQAIRLVLSDSVTYDNLTQS